MASIFDGFASAISQTKDFAQRFVMGGAKTKEEIQREIQFNDNVRNAIAKVDSIPVVGKGVTATGDFVLKVAMKLNEEVISPLITRPMSTLALLTDTNSPLYKKGEHEEGFQVSDIKDAYNRSVKVSTAQALTRSNLIPLVSGLAGVVLPNGGINPDEINLWNDESIKKNFVDNNVGRWFTGIGDFALGNIGIGAAGKLAKIPLVAGATKAGLYTKAKTVEEFAKDLYTPGTVGNSHMEVLANSKDIGEISGIVNKYSTNENLISLLYEVKTSSAAADMILADKGNLAAIERLAKTSPSDLFELSGTQQVLAGKFLSTGSVYIPEGAAVARIKSAFDHAIAKDEQFTKIREAFFDDSYSPTPGGRNYMPMEPVIGKEALIKAQGKLRERQKYGRVREDVKSASILETRVGNLRLIKWSRRQGEYSPQGFVTFSGSRPGQAREELNAFLNNIKLFDDGNAKLLTSTGVKETVADIRRRMEVAFVQSGTGVKQLEALQKIDEEVGTLLMRSKHIYGEDEIKNYIAKYRAEIIKNAEAFQKNGYGVDHTGRGILTDPQTLSQMKDSYRFTPWDHIERDINHDIAKSVGKLKPGVEQVAHVARTTLDGLNRAWTFDVLARPMFIVKQSIAEPIISATLAQGMGIIWRSARPMAKRMTHNTFNRAMESASRIHNRGDLKAIRTHFKALEENFSEAAFMKDLSQTEVEHLLSGKGSPAAVKSGLAQARANLEAVDSLLDKIELDFMNSAKKYGTVEAMPSLTMLERRMAYIKKYPNKLSTKNRGELLAAETAINDYKAVIQGMATNKAVIQAADAKLAAAYAKIDGLVKEQGKLFTDRANVYGKSAEYKARYYDKATHDIVVNGQVLTIDSFIAGDSAFSAAMRAEVANAVSVENTYMKEASIGVYNNISKRKVPGQPIRTSDANYFEELAYIANRHFRNDPLMNLIMQEKPYAEIMKWAKSQEGISYLKDFDIVDPALGAAHVQEKMGLINRMFPSATARAAIVKGEVTSNNLEKALRNHGDELFDLHPTDFDYGIADGIGRSNTMRVIDNATASVFKFMMKAENPIREMYFNDVATKVVASKAEYLMAQGVKMTPARLNALRQSAVREAIEDTEKTFYTVNRQTRIMKNARLLVAFPNATLNAFARYGRIAVNNPTRTAQAVSSYGRGFMSFGVDQNGNKTDDFNAITHILLPGSRELGKALGSVELANNGIALNAKSIGFLLNQPSPSWVTGISIGTVMKGMPKSEEQIRSVINILGPDVYDQWFPFGPPDNLTNMMITPWMRATYNALVGPEGQKEYLASWNSVYNYHKTMVDLGIEKTFPTDKMIREQTKNLWALKAFYSFASPFGVPIKGTTSPMGLTSTLYFKLRDKAFADGATSEQASTIAADGMLAALGPNFKVDRVSFTGSNKNLNMPQTQEAYSRIFNDNDALVKQLSGIDKNSISIVGLLVSDLSNDPAQRSDVITKLLSNPDLTLKGTSHAINDLKMTPQEVEIERLKSRTWSQYNQIKDALTAKITDGKSLRSHPELRAVLSSAAETILKKESPQWYDEFMLAQNGDSSYKYAKGLNLIVTNSDFMSKHGTTKFWKDAQLFMYMRNIFVQMYQSLPDYDPRKAKLMDAYNTTNEQLIAQWDPKLQTIIKNSFDNDTLKAVN